MIGGDSLRVALLGDMMLGGAVADRIDSGRPLFSDGVRAVLAEADLVMANLECCISRRGSEWPAPGKRFFFRASPLAAEVLADLGVDCLTLANNHVLDYGIDGLRDTLAYLADAGIEVVGAGMGLRRAQAPAVLNAAGMTVAVLAFTDHPADLSSTPHRAFGPPEQHYDPPASAEPGTTEVCG